MRFHSPYAQSVPITVESTVAQIAMTTEFRVPSRICGSRKMARYHSREKCSHLVKREELKDRRGKSGFFNRRHQQVSGYKITVENFKDKPQRIVVFDQLPVSGNDDIKVTLADSSTKPTETDTGTGKLTWDMVLKPREKHEIVLEFTVDWPQDRQVSGM